jgi:hypothetical protein
MCFDQLYNLYFSPKTNVPYSPWKKLVCGRFIFNKIVKKYNIPIKKQSRGAKKATELLF